MKKLGIIGGASWSSTALYYEHINRAVAQRQGGLHSARLLIESLDFADYAAFHASEDWDSANQLIVESAEALKRAGVDGLLLASNTMHKAVGAVAAATRLPIVDIRAATADRLAEDGRTHVALLGTRFTMTEPFARERLDDNGIVVQQVAPEWVAEIDRIIYEELAAGRVVRDSQRKLRTLITEMASSSRGDRAGLHRAGAGGRRPCQRAACLRHHRNPRPRRGRLDAGRRRRTGPRRRLNRARSLVDHRIEATDRSAAGGGE